MRKLFFIAVLAVAATCLVNCSKDNGDYGGNLSGLVIAINDGGTGYFTNSNGEMLFGKQFEAVKPFSEGLAAVKVDGKWGFIGTDGKIKINCTYDEVHDCNDGMIWVRDKTQMKFGCIDNTGRMVIGYKYSEAADFIDGFAVVTENSKCSMIDKMGSAVLSNYDYIWDHTDEKGYDNEFVCVRKDGKYGYYNKNTRVMITPEYDGASYMFSAGSDGMAYVCWDGKWGFIDKSGKKVIQNNYYGAGYYSESDDLAPVKDKNNHWGFIDKNGTLKIPYKYIMKDKSFSENLASVQDTTYKKWGFIDRNDNVVLPFVYDASNHYFSDGICIVKQGKKCGIINKSGAAVVPFKYDDIENQDDNLVFMVKKNGFWGLIDRSGREIISPMYDYECIDWSFL